MPSELAAFGEMTSHLANPLVLIGQAEEAYRKVVTLGEANGDTMAIAMGTGNLGLIYRKRGELDRAEEIYRKALALFKAVGAAPQIKQTETLLDSLNESRAER